VLVTAAGALALAGGLATAGPAAAHDRLESTNPADGAPVATAPDAVVLTMSSTPLALGTQVRVTGPDGTVSEGNPQIVDATVSEPLTGARPAGTYQVEWRITSSDGHPVSGSFSFTATGAAGGGATTSSSSPSSSTSPGASSSSPAVVDPSNPVASDGDGGLIAAGIAVVVVVGGIGGFIGYRRRRG
jgi:methionine-rich copper-binding protein CopC